MHYVWVHDTMTASAAEQVALINQTILQLKNTSLVSAVAVGDLLYQGTVITGASFRPLEVYTVIAAIYFAILFPLTLVANRIEKRLGASK